MREIKFIAWDIINNKIVKVQDIDFINNHLHFLNKTFKGNPTFITDYILMQYSGLKDVINKNEVYEYDIINLVGVGFLKVEWDYTNTGWICIDKHYKKRNLSDVLLNGGIRVGNIYENKELLES